MDPTDSPRFVVATRVRPGRDSDFEQFLREVVIPAVAKVRPHQVGMWNLLRPADDPPEGASRAWVMTFHGSSTLDEWDLQPLLDEAHGAELSASTWRDSRTWSRASRLSTRSPETSCSDPFAPDGSGLRPGAHRLAHGTLVPIVHRTPLRIPQDLSKMALNLG